jgi:hypothetical protein
MLHNGGMKLAGLQRRLEGAGSNSHRSTAVAAPAGPAAYPKSVRPQIVMSNLRTVR